MSKKKEMHVELRYYEIPQNEHSLGLVGESWDRVYHADVKGLHFHNLMEIGYCFRGEGQLTLEGGSVIDYSTGTCTVFPQNMPHGTFSYGEDPNYWEFIFIDPESFLGGVYNTDQIFTHDLTTRVGKKSYVLKESDAPILGASIRALMLEKREPKEFAAEIEKCLVLKLLLEIARMNPLVNEHGEQPHKRRKVMLTSLDYVNEHYHESIKIKTLAGICHMSETHFRRLFEEVIHMTPVDYINFVRIQKACEYLNSTNDTMQNVARKVGYISQSSFNRNFSRFVGTTPCKWKAASDSNKLKLLNYKITAHKGW